MSKSARSLLKALNGVIVFFLLASALAPTMPVAAQRDIKPAGATATMTATSLKYGTGWSRSPLPPSTSVPRLSTLPDAQPKQTPKEELSLKVSVNPEIYMPGKPVSLHWQVRGITKQTNQETEVAIKASPNILPTDAALKATLAQQGELRFP